MADQAKSDQRVDVFGPELGGPSSECQTGGAIHFHVHDLESIFHPWSLWVMEIHRVRPKTTGPGVTGT